MEDKLIRNTAVVVASIIMIAIALYVASIFSVTLEVLSVICALGLIMWMIYCILG